jgi:hypothetical protein
VRARLEVRASDPVAPERAAAELTESLLSVLPRRRPITLAVVGHGPHPGLVVAPWSLSAVFGQLVEREQAPAKVVVLGDSTTGETALRKAAARVPGERDCFEWPAIDRSVVLRPAGERGEPARIPREVVGTSLLVIAPLLHRRVVASGRETWVGPVAGAIGALARACGVARTSKLEPDRLVAAGQSLLAEVFCGVGMLIDATWAGVAEAEPEPIDSLVRKLGGKLQPPAPVVPTSELVAPERVLALGDLGRLALPELLGVDDWLAQLLGLGVRARRSSTPEVEGTHERWPHLAIATRAAEPGLAGRAITGLRNQGSKAKAKVGALMGGSTPRAALPARVPGRFATEWTRRWYGEEPARTGDAASVGPSRKGRRS